MSVSKALVLFSFLACCSAYNIDVKTTNHVLKVGEPNSLFGYSLTLHDGSSFTGKTTIFVGAPRGNIGLIQDHHGNLMECKVEETDCTQVIVDEQFDNKQQMEREAPHKYRKNQWLGATVYSNGGGRVVVCAPRYSEKEENKYYMVGKCIVAHRQIQRIHLFPCTRIEPDHGQATRSDNGFCQAGFSAAIRPENTFRPNAVIMGAVMGKDQLGTVFQQTDNSEKKFLVASSDQSGDGFYLGYAVTYGKFYLQSEKGTDIAAGIPRIEFSGKVNIYSQDLTYKASVNPPERVQLKREYIYFGASVCAVDVNNDGYDDLLVGAPFYSDKGGDEGRVYIYLSTEIQSTQGGRRVLTLSSGEKSLDPGLRGSNTKGARFGWSIAKAGDLNNDEIHDFIVGAPQDEPDLDNDGFGNGAVYVYYGRRDGNIDKYQQKITAGTVKAFYPNFQQFGYAITGNLDTNGDEYPDIAIGAWQSDRVLLLRTRPVMDLKATMTLSKTEILVDNFTANCADNSSKQCLDIEVCFSYIGKSVSGRHEIKYTLELDPETTSKGFKRVYIAGGSSKIYETTASFNLTGKNVTKCVNFYQIYVEDKNRLTDALSRGTTEILFNMKYELVSPPECETTTLCPVLDQSKSASVSEKATIVLNCSDNTCDYNLKVTITPDMKEITIGKTKIITALIELSNQGEISYNPEVIITHDPTLQYEKITVNNKQFRLEWRPVPSENATITEIFRVQGPLQGNERVSFRLQYSTDKVIGNKPVLYINVKAIATGGQEKDPKDNNATASITVRRDVAMKITGTSVPKLLNYPATAPVLNIQENNDFSAVNISSVGPSATVTLELTNKGVSDLQTITLSISYPFKKFQGQPYEYIVYPIKIEERGNGLCHKTGVLNPANVTIPTNDEKRRRRRRDSPEELKPRTTSKGTFTCNINELKASDRFIVTFEFRLWVATLVEYHPKDLVLVIEANAEYTDSLNVSSTPERASGEVSIQVTPENTPAKAKSTPVWVIIVAVLGGVLLLALAILALFKLGFFKRNRPPQDISSPQTDDVPPVVPS